MSIEFKPLPPREAIEFFRSKGLAPVGQRFAWWDYWREEHARGFVVAKAMRDDVLGEIRSAAERALAEGQTLEMFRDELEPKLKAFGWWGSQIDTDPVTGEVKEVQLGSRHRLRVIFDTNMRTSYAAGQWQRIWRTRAAFPYLEYQQIQRPTKRHDHERYHGLIRPVEDPIWQRIFPPNGWFCGCGVRPMNDGMLRREGKSVSDPIELEAEPFENPRTGETSDLPIGVHPGFDTNPGASWLDMRSRHRSTRIDSLGPHAEMDLALVEEIRARGLRDGDESLAVYDLQRPVERALIDWSRSKEDGPKSAVGFSQAMVDVFNDRDADAVAIHDHPSSGSFSPADVRMLRRFPGLSEVVAVGLDGSLYRMRFEGTGSESGIDEAWQAASQVMRLEIGRGGITVEDAQLLHAHLFSLLLERAGLIRYRAAMSGRRQDALRRAGHVVATFVESISR